MLRKIDKLSTSDQQAEETRAERLKKLSRLRREEQKEGLRRTILDAAGALFLERGYEGFSMRQVAELIGYSATTLYRYFENKDDLLYAVVYEGFVVFRDRLVSAAQSRREPLKRLEALGQAYVRFGVENPVYYQMMFMQRADFLFRSRGEDEQGPMIESFNVLQMAVESAMQTGAMKRGDVRTFSYVIWSMVHGLTALAIADPKRFDEAELEKSTKLALGVLLDGIRHR